MAVKINNIEYSGFFFNGEALTAMYLNGNKVYGGEPQPVWTTSSQTISYTALPQSGLMVGETHNLNASTTPTGGTLSYSSSNSSVATVDSNGIVSGIASGSTTITITASEYVDDENRIVYRSGTSTVNLSVEEASQPFNSVEILSTEVIDSSYDDNLHVTMNSSHANGSYYMFIIEASGNFTYTYNKKPEGSGNGVLQFESLMSEDFYTENPQGYDTAIDQYWSEDYNGNYDDPNAAQITVTGLPKGKYMLRFFAPTYNLQVLGKWYVLRRAMHGFFTIS